MTLTDTGPLVALIDSADSQHARCQALYVSLSFPLISTVPCFTEALYLLGRAGGWHGQNALLHYRKDSALVIHRLTDTEIDRAATLMETCCDTSCDFADASLLTASETLYLRRIFTLDKHFFACRRSDGTFFEVVPEAVA